MPLSLPPTDKSLGNKVVAFLTTAPAAPSGIPTITEINAGLFASLHLYTPFNVTSTQNTGEGPRKLGTKFVPTQLGQVSYEAVEAQYSFKHQNAGTEGGDGNELYDILTPGVTVTAVVLNGLNGTTTESVSADDVADIFLMQCGERNKTETGDGEFDEFSVTQQMIVVGGEPLATDLALAAA